MLSCSHLIPFFCSGSGFCCVLTSIFYFAYSFPSPLSLHSTSLFYLPTSVLLAYICRLLPMTSILISWAREYLRATRSPSCSRRQLFSPRSLSSPLDGTARMRHESLPTHSCYSVTHHALVPLLCVLPERARATSSLRCNHGGARAVPFLNHM